MHVLYLTFKLQFPVTGIHTVKHQHFCFIETSNQWLTPFSSNSHIQRTSSESMSMPGMARQSSRSFLLWEDVSVTYCCTTEHQHFDFKQKGLLDLAVLCQELGQGQAGQPCCCSRGQLRWFTRWHSPSLHVCPFSDPPHRSMDFLPACWSQVVTLVTQQPAPKNKTGSRSDKPLQSEAQNCTASFCWIWSVKASDKKS